MRLRKSFIKKAAGLAILSTSLYSSSAFAQQVLTGTTGNVGDLITDLYGGDGVTLDPGIVFHEAHFTADSKEALVNLSNIIASSIGVISFNSSVTAFSFDIEEGVAVQSQQSLGPLLAERASTVGKGRINIGASYTSVRYNRLNGTRLNNLELSLAHDREFGVPFEDDIVLLSIDLELDQQILAFTGTYGVSDNLDVGLVIPLVNVDGSARSVATIFSELDPTPHLFGGAVNPIASNKASATGIGDIQVRAKWVVPSSTESQVNAAVLLQATLATGDEKDLLGSGSSAFYLGGVVSAELGKINPHINIGYEKYFDQPVIPGLDTNRSNIRGLVGFDLRVSDKFVVAPELIGRRQDDGRSFYDIALGTKWAPVGAVPISANIVVPINRNQGLRANFYFTLGIESTF
jgi:hypothetical protein